MNYSHNFGNNSFVLYILLFHTIILLVCLIKTYSFLNYKRQFIYCVCIEDAIKHLAKTLRKVEFKGACLNIQTLKANLLKIKDYLENIKEKELTPLDCTIYKEIISTYNLVSTINERNIIDSIHTNGKLRLFEITLLLFDYNKELTINGLVELIKLFNNIRKLTIDELYNAKDVITLALALKFYETTQEYIKYKENQNKGQFRALDSNSALIDYANTLILIKDISTLIEDVGNFNFLSTHYLYAKIENKNVLTEINYLTKLYKKDEHKIYDAITYLSKKFSKSIEEIMSEYGYSIAFALNHKRHAIKIKSQVLEDISFVICYALVNVSLTFLAALSFYFSAKLRLIFVNYLALLIISRHITESILSMFLKKKGFTKFVSSSKLYKIIRIGSYISIPFQVVLLLSGIILNDLKIIMDALIICAIYPTIFLLRKFKERKNCKKHKIEIKEKIICENKLEAYKSNMTKLNSFLLQNNKLKAYLNNLGTIYLEDVKDEIDHINPFLTGFRLLFNNDISSVEFSYSQIKYILNGNEELTAYLDIDEKILFIKAKINDSFIIKVNDLSKEMIIVNDQIKIVGQLNLIKIRCKNGNFKIKNENQIIFCTQNKNEDLFVFVNLSNINDDKNLKVDERYAKIQFFANERKNQILSKNSKLPIFYGVKLSNYIFHKNLLNAEQSFRILNAEQKRTKVYILKNEDQLQTNMILEWFNYFYRAGEEFKVFCEFNKDIDKIKIKNYEFVHFVKNGKKLLKNEQKLIESNLGNIKDIINYDVNIKFTINDLYSDEENCGFIKIKDLENIDKIIDENKEKSIDYYSSKRAEYLWVKNIGLFNKNIKRIIVNDCLKMFLICDKKIYNFTSLFLKMRLNWKYYKNKNVVNTDIIQFNINRGVNSISGAYMFGINIKKCSNNSYFIIDMAAVFQDLNNSNFCIKKLNSNLYMCTFLRYSFRIFIYLNFEHESYYSSLNIFQINSEYYIYNYKDKNYADFNNLLIRFNIKNEQNYTIFILTSYNSYKMINKKNCSKSLKEPVNTNFYTNLILYSEHSLINKVVNQIYPQIISNFITHDVFVGKAHKIDLNMINIALNSAYYFNNDLCELKIKEIFDKIVKIDGFFIHFNQFFKIEKYDISSIIHLIQIISNYLENTNNYDILNNDIYFLIFKNNTLCPSNSTKKLIDLVSDNILLLKEQELTVFNTILVFNSIKKIVKFVDNNYKQFFNNFSAILLEKINDLYRHNYFTVKHTNLSTIFALLLSDEIIDVNKQLIFENLSLSIENLSAYDQVQYLKVLNKLYVLSDKELDFIVNKIKSFDEYLDNPVICATYYNFVINHLFGVKIKNFIFTPSKNYLVQDRAIFKLKNLKEKFDIVLKKHTTELDNLSNIDLLSIKNDLIV